MATPPEIIGEPTQPARGVSEHTPDPFQSWRMSRWTRRLSYARNRFANSLEVLKVRLWRKPMVRWHYSRTDYAPPPCSITLRLTSHCNLRCVQCGQWGAHGAFMRPDRQPFGREMTTAEWKVFIDQAASFCPHIYFFGGEPFLRKDCVELIRHATSRKIIGIPRRLRLAVFRRAILTP